MAAAPPVEASHRGTRLVTAAVALGAVVSVALAALAMSGPWAIRAPTMGCAVVAAAASVGAHRASRSRWVTSGRRRRAVAAATLAVTMAAAIGGYRWYPVHPSPAVALGVQRATGEVRWRATLPVDTVEALYLAGDRVVAAGRVHQSGCRSSRRTVWLDPRTGAVIAEAAGAAGFNPSDRGFGGQVLSDVTRGMMGMSTLDGLHVETPTSSVASDRGWRLDLGAATRRPIPVVAAGATLILTTQGRVPHSCWS